MIVARSQEAAIDSQYLMAGRMAALKDGQRQEEHPVTAEEIGALNKLQYTYAKTNLTLVYARILEQYYWFIGQHHLRLDTNARRFVPMESNKIPRRTLNFVHSFTETIVGTLAKGIVRGNVVPNSADPRDRAGARAANKISKYKWELDKMGDIFRGLIMTAAVAGDAYAFTEISSESSESVEMDLPDGSTFRMSLPDVRTMLVHPLQIFHNPSATSLQDARWSHIHMLQTEEFIKEQYPHTKDSFAAEVGTDLVSNYQWRLQEIMLRQGPSRVWGAVENAGMPYSNVERQAMVHQIMFKPNRYYPEGRMFIVAGDAICYAGKLAPPSKKVMLTHYPYSPVDKSIHSMSLARGLIECTKHIESEVSQNVLSRKTQAMRLWLAPKTAGGSFLEGQIRAEPGAILKFRPGPKGETPQAIQGTHPADAGYIASVNLFFEQFLEEISGRRQVLAGDRPQGIQAGIALKQLAQWASVRFAPKISKLMECVEQTETNRLMALAESPAWQFPRRIGLPGRAGRTQWSYFTAGDLNDNYTYKIEAEPKDLNDEATQLQIVMDLAGAGYINMIDPVVAVRNRRIIQQMAGLEDKGFHDTGSVDFDRAESKLAKVLDGEDVHPEPKENFRIHLEIFREYTQSDDYDLADPFIKVRLDRYMRELQAYSQLMKLGAMHQEADIDEMAEATAGGEPEMPAMLPEAAGPSSPGGPKPKTAARPTAKPPMPSSQTGAAA